MSRGFGDFGSKRPERGGVQGCVISEPDVLDYDVEEMDFIVLGCDGIFDKLSSEEIVATVWETIHHFSASADGGFSSAYEEMLDSCVNNVLKRALVNKSEDNVTCIIVFFKSLDANLKK